MVFDKGNVRCTLNASYKDIGVWGYFANNLAVLQKTVTKEQTSIGSLYAKLVFILDEKEERRFESEYGIYSLFYPLGKTHDVNKY